MEKLRFIGILAYPKMYLNFDLMFAILVPTNTVEEI
jgi:hypothetical protein